MSVRRLTRVYSGWRKGVSGSGDELAGEYNSYNAQVYENGSLGPRPGWKAHTDAGGIFDETNDTFRGLLWRRDGTDAESLVAVFDDASDSSTRKYSIGDITSVPGTITWGTPAATSSVLFHSQTYPAAHAGDVKSHLFFDGVELTIIGGKVYTSFPSAAFQPTMDEGVPAAATLYRDRMYYWGFSSNPGRVYYSDAAAYNKQQGSTVWTGSVQFFDLNYDSTLRASAVTGMWSIKNALLIARKDGRWLVLTGVSPDTGTLRELGRDRVPTVSSGSIVDNQLYFLSQSGRGVSVGTPSFVDATSLGSLAPTRYPTSTLPLPTDNMQPERAISHEDSRFVFLPCRPDRLTDNQIIAVEFVNDSWTYSQWATNLTLTNTEFSQGRPNILWSTIETASSWATHSRNYTLNRPANSGDTHSVSLTTEAATASGSLMKVVLGQISGSAHATVRPAKVVLDIDYWKGGSYSAPSMTIDAKTLGTTAATSEDSATQVVIDTSGWSSTTGDQPSRRAVVAAVEQMQFGQELEIILGGDGWALRNVRVYYEELDDVR